VAFNNDEAAARFYLTQVFARDNRPRVRGLAAPDQPEAVPDMRLVRAQDSPLTSTRLVTFEQTQARIPIFGSLARVELSRDRQLVALDAEVTSVEGVSPAPSISPADALQSIAKLTEVEPASLGSVEPAELTFYHDEDKDTWHLTYFFKNVPAAPKDFLEQAAQGRRHGLGRSPRDMHPRINYLVDAHSGAVVRYYSAAPMLLTPSKCKGIDEEDQHREFYGLRVPGGFDLHDPLRAIKTYDLNFGDIEGQAFPGGPLHNNVADLGATSKAAVSAHVNAMRVYDFYKDVLKRDGVDDKGMDLVSVVNCTYAADEPAPQWHNAVWWNNRMWYGQTKDGSTFRSFSRFLDVIAHELTHGVTEYTSGLVYQDQSGALNESFSDIFGIIINNWGRVGPDTDVGTWTWELGSGLGGEGLPLRDLSNPKRTDDPDHMDDYLSTSWDNGGVHTNSNIHNKAAYNVFTATDAQAQRVFPVREVAILYYLCLTRLNSLATFSKTLQVLVDVAETLYAGDLAEQQRKVDHIKEAYQKVGITLG
jgi:Zn-dependent metalloprotease